MTPTNLDLKEICLELARVKITADEYRNKGYSYGAVSVLLDDIDAIAATVIAQQAKIDKLAEENERLKEDNKQLTLDADGEPFDYGMGHKKAARKGDPHGR